MIEAEACVELECAEQARQISTVIHTYYKICSSFESKVVKKVNTNWQDTPWLPGVQIQL